MPALPITFNEYLQKVQYLSAHNLQAFAIDALRCPEIARKESRVYRTLHLAFRDHLPEREPEFREAWFQYKRETKILHKEDLYELTIFCPEHKTAVRVKKNNRTKIDLSVKDGVIVIRFRCPECHNFHEIQWIEVCHAK